ncbi:MAG TPA: hypothetical protein VGC13_25125 [Longimicrobium sp.]|jgi:hypothetical protein|uniref:hypothetical protein n=1 Tax=Longimicrobium sp. TaxID=2029185 RepID=UPI002EDAA2B2
MSSPIIEQDFTQEALDALARTELHLVQPGPLSENLSAFLEDGRLMATQLAAAGLELRARMVFHDKWVPVTLVYPALANISEADLPDNVRVVLTPEQRAASQRAAAEFSPTPGYSQYADTWREFSTPLHMETWKFVGGRLASFAKVGLDVNKLAKEGPITSVPRSFGFAMVSGVLGLTNLSLQEAGVQSALAYAAVSCTALVVRYAQATPAAGGIVASLGPWALIPLTVGALFIDGVVAKECIEQLGKIPSEIQQLLERESRIRQAAETLGRLGGASHYDRPDDVHLRLYRAPPKVEDGKAAPDEKEIVVLDGMEITPSPDVDHEVRRKDGGNGHGKFENPEQRPDNGSVCRYAFDGSVRDQNGNLCPCEAKSERLTQSEREQDDIQIDIDLNVPK